MGALNLPNMLTLFRLLILPAVVTLIWPGIESRATCFWAGLLYVIGAILDLVDGAVARHNNQVTVFGKFLDPLVDKLLYLVTLIALLQLPDQRIPHFIVMIALIRELSITGLRAIASSEGIVIAAGEGGKLKTTFANIGVIALILHYPYLIDLQFASAYIYCHRVGLFITYISVFFSVTSAIRYVRDFVRTLPAHVR